VAERTGSERHGISSQEVRLSGTRDTSIMVPVILAALCLVLLFAIWLAAFHLGAGERADAALLNRFLVLRFEPGAFSTANSIARLADPGPFALLSLVPVALALGYRRPAAAAAIAAVILGSTATTELLKHLVVTTHPPGLLTHNWGLPPGSWPSGHSTAAMSLGLSLALAVPRRAGRGLLSAEVLSALAVGILFAIAVGYAVLALGWHYPSDVAAGYLVAIVWWALVNAALTACGLDARTPGRR
jgi:membrane-associated phospholipid phosphatase